MLTHLVAIIANYKRKAQCLEVCSDSVSYIRKLTPEVENSHPTPSSEPPTSARYAEGELPLASRDDWWYKGTDNLFLNRSGERRMH